MDGNTKLTKSQTNLIATTFTFVMNTEEDSYSLSSSNDDSFKSDFSSDERYNNFMKLFLLANKKLKSIFLHFLPNWSTDPQRYIFPA